MEALYLEIKNLIISTLNLDELSADDIDTDAALFGDGLVWTPSMRWSWVWR
ncbi:acyl carrier protein (plasmid) [Klebsiella aerogenes]|nr:acyl carrier protein [Klebsiella aerogenes]